MVSSAGSISDRRHTLAAASFIFSAPRRPRGHSRGRKIRAATPVAGALQGLVTVTPHPVTPRDKALRVNLDPRFYGTFAEIGAGQEVVRWFFHAGAAAGTIAKSISAYDMQVSDAIYGPCKRYVCRERLEAMLDYE